MKKRVILTLLILSLSFQTVYALELKDVDYNTELGKAIARMVDARVIDGYTDGTFRADDNIRRSEFIKILNLTFAYTDMAKELSFSDVRSGDWYYNYLLTAVQYKYINGYPDGSFRPDGFITREEFCKIIVNVLNVQELPFNKKISDKVSDWAKPFVNKIVSSRIMLLEDDNKFRATDPITRGEVCIILSNYIVSKPSLPGVGGNTETEEGLKSTLTVLNKALLNNVIPELSNEAQKKVCKMIYDNIDMYLQDSSHDYKSAANKAYKIYQTLSEEEKTELQNTILKYTTIGELSELKRFFFPE